MSKKIITAIIIKTLNIDLTKLKLYWMNKGGSEWGKKGKIFLPYTTVPSVC